MPTQGFHPPGLVSVIGKSYVQTPQGYQASTFEERNIMYTHVKNAFCFVQLVCQDFLRNIFFIFNVFVNRVGHSVIGEVGRAELRHASSTLPLNSTCCGLTLVISHQVISLSGGGAT